MNDKVYLGIEFGDLELRVVYIVNSDTVELPLPLDVSNPQILIEPYSDTSNIGVGFPTVLQKLGTHMSFAQMSLKVGREFRASREQSIETPESVLMRTLSIVNHSMLKVTGNSVAETVFAVPASMRQNGRKALLDCARNAGLGEVNLIDRCTAAALGYHSKDTEKSTTALVYDMGYGNCEYALLRLAHERCRVMNSGTVADVSGEALDALMIEETVLALRKRKIYLGLKHFTPFQWQELRHVVAQARNKIAANENASITLIPNLTGLDKTIRFEYASEPFKLKVTPMINKTIEGVHGLLEQNALEVADIDTILLVGSSAGMSPISDILSEAFEGKATRTDPAIIARGAAWHACQLTSHSSERPVLVSSKPPEEILDTPANGGLSTPVVDEEKDAEGGFVHFVDGEDEAPEQTQPKQRPAILINAGISWLDIAKNLIEQGRTQEASILLDNTSSQVEQLRAMLAQAEKFGESRLMVQQALTLVDSGYDFLRAVDLTHLAYQQSPGDPQVFEGMLKVHIQAGLQLSSTTEYEDSIRILMCALNHDQTNRTIRDALAERHYNHAVVMRNKSDPAYVFEIVDKALSFNAKHDGLNKLLSELGDQMSEPKE